MSDAGEANSRAFASQTVSVEDLFKDQTVGLVRLEDFRKRRRDVEDLKNNTSGTVTPKTENSDADSDVTLKKKKRKTVSRKLLSFEQDGDGEDTPASRLRTLSTGADTPDVQLDSAGADSPPKAKRKIKSNPHSHLPMPKAVTKASQAVEAAERDRLRAEFIQIQELVRESEIAIPFVFYDGSSLPGGTVKIKKGEHIWLFLERCRKLGAEMGVSSGGSVEGGGTKQRVDGKKSWARIGVDDLMLIRHDIIIPHHYDFYYFIANKIADPANTSRSLFKYSDTASLKDTDMEPPVLKVSKYERVEGQDDDPEHTKVVDRRWYEKNKHIYPASLWREYRTGKEHEELLKGRRDTQGNLFFYS